MFNIRVVRGTPVEHLLTRYFDSLQVWGGNGSKKEEMVIKKADS